MIRITVEIIPHGIEEKKFTHSIANIWNTGATTKETHGLYGDYQAEFMQSHLFNPKKVWKKSKALNIHRQRRGVWDIIFCLLYNAGLYARNKQNLNQEDNKAKAGHKR